ncbi:MAG: magnesium transport protein CorA [Pirellulaceae bacterium]|nr:MAG: magnesium transport protein CorA [Pirellulaceae bacterium]
MARRKRKKRAPFQGLLSQVSKPFRRPSPAAGQPGVLVAPAGAPPPHVTLICYDASSIDETTLSRPAELEVLKQTTSRIWLDIDGLGEPVWIEKAGALLDLHPLALEDVVHVHQRAKVEDYGRQLFIVARMPSYEEHLETEQLSMFVGDNYVVTIQEGRPGDCFQWVRQRLRSADSLLRQRGSDYLAYALLDAVIDGYFPIVERFGDQLNQLDEQLSELNSRVPLGEIHRVRSELLLVRRAIWPHREAINHLLRETTPFITPEARIYLRDCYDHTLQLIDVIETYRDMCSDLRDFQLAAAGHRANEIMKVLTIISTIFIPLSFVAGIYGMNFRYMPELEWRYGYFAALGLMAIMAAGLVGYIWKRGWFR